jgi:hypothetical protein
MKYFFISAYILRETGVQNIRHKIVGTATRLGARDSALIHSALNGSEAHRLLFKVTADSLRGVKAAGAGSRPLISIQCCG